MRSTRALLLLAAVAASSALGASASAAPGPDPVLPHYQVAALPGQLLVLHEDAEQPLTGIELAADGDVVLVVGPEGGLTPDELDTLRAAGAAVVRLGRSVLRTSTAGAAAAAVVSARTGRW